MNYFVVFVHLKTNININKSITVIIFFFYLHFYSLKLFIYLIAQFDPLATNNTWHPDLCQYEHIFVFKWKSE